MVNYHARERTPREECVISQTALCETGGGGGAQRYFMEDLVEIFAGILLGCLKISLDICFWSRGDLRKGDI